MTFSYSTTIPATNNDPADDQPQIQTNFASISGLISTDHVGFNVSGGGQHEQVTFNANNVPSPPVSPPVLFTNTVAAIPQLFFYSGDSAHSSSQYVASGNGSTFALGGIIFKWGNTGVVSDNSNVSFASAFPNNCYAVLLTIVDPNASSKTINVKTGSLTTSQFTVRVSTGSISAYYLAIGN